MQPYYSMVSIVSCWSRHSQVEQLGARLLCGCTLLATLFAYYMNVLYLLHHFSPGTCGRSRGVHLPSSSPRAPSCASARRPPHRTARRSSRRRRRPSPATTMPLGCPCGGGWRGGCNSHPGQWVWRNRYSTDVRLVCLVSNSCREKEKCAPCLPAVTSILHRWYQCRPFSTPV